MQPAECGAGGRISLRRPAPQTPLPNGVHDQVGFPSRRLSTQIVHALDLADPAPAHRRGCSRSEISQFGEGSDAFGGDGV